MGNKLKRTVLGDYFTLQRGTTYKSRLLGQPGPVLLGLASIQRNGGFRSDSLKTYGGESPDKLLVYPGELYLSLKDVTQSADLLGAVARLPLNCLPGRLTQDTVKLQPKDKSVPVEYLYWLLRTPQYRGHCRAHATGTTNLGLSRDDFFAFPAPEPTPIQHRIVHVLDALDDKIELNRRINETLEGMARALFQSWFVDFEPVRAKQRGQKPAGMDAATAALFPSDFEDSALGEIPKGWKVGRLDDLLLLQRGFDLPTQDRVQGRYPVVSAGGFSGTNNDYRVHGPGIVTGRSGVLGRVFYVHTDFWPLNTCLWVKEFRRAKPVYAYFLLHTIDFAVFNAGSAVPTLNRNHVHNYPCVVPPDKVVERFETLTRPLFARSRANEEQSESLVAVRDTLLPKLMSGEVRVKDAEKVIGASR